MPNELRSAAISYCQKYSVIPIEARGKRALVQWEEFQSHRADETQVKEWWKTWPDANVGIVTGAISELVVVDVDTQEAGRMLRESVKGLDLRTTPRVKTGKGWQLFYKHPGIPLGNRTAVLPNLDIRGDGGYVVAPPSIHPNGGRYQWEVPITEQLPAIPVNLYNLIKEPPQTHGKVFKDNIVWEGIPEGQRDVQVFKYACHLRAFACPEHIALDLVLAAAAHCKPPLSEFEARLKLKQAYKYPEGKKGQPVQSFQPTDQSEFWPSLITTKQLLSHIDETKWLWKNAIPEGGIGMIAGQPRVGKSTLALNLGLAVSRGADFLNRPTAKSRVAYISVDNSVAEMKNIAAGIGLREFDDLLFHVGQIPQQATAWLFDLIAKNSIKFAVIDTFQRFLNIDEINDSAKVTQAMDPINHEAEKLGCSLLWVHHSGKSSTQTGALGSIAIKGMCPYYFELVREEGARIFSSDLRGGKNFDGCHLKIDHSSGWNIFAGSRQDALIEKAGEKIMDVLNQIGPLSAKEIQDLVEARWQITRLALSQLFKSGHVERTGKGGKTDPFKYTAAAEINSWNRPSNSNGNSYYIYRKSGTRENNEPDGEISKENQDVILVPRVELQKNRDSSIISHTYSGSHVSGTTIMPKTQDSSTDSHTYSGSRGFGNQKGTTTENEPKNAEKTEKTEKAEKNSLVKLDTYSGSRDLGTTWEPQSEKTDDSPVTSHSYSGSRGKNERPVLCRNCYVPMVDYECPKCGLKHSVNT